MGEVRMRSEIKAMPAAGCADRPAGGADGARGGKKKQRLEQGTDGTAAAPRTCTRAGLMREFGLTR